MRSRAMGAALAMALAGVMAAGATAEQVTLRFKFKPGEVLKYRFYADVDGQVKMNMPMMQQGAGGMPQQMPVKMVMQGTGQGKVLATDAAGGARLRIKADQLTMTMKMMGHNMKMEMAGGTTKMWQDGKLMSNGQGAPNMPGMQKMPMFDQPIELKISPRGKVLDLRIPGMEQMMQSAPFAMPGMDMKTLMQQYPQVLLPANPVALGQTWQETMSVPFSPQMAIPVTYRAMLENIEQTPDKQVAVIGVASSMSAPNIDMGQMMKQSAAAAGQAGMPMPDMQGRMSMASNLAGTLRFNTTAGCVERFDGRQNMQMAMNMTMQMPPEAQQQGGPASMNIGMGMNMVAKFALARL